MKTLISIDPGMSTGVIIGTYSDTEPYKLTHAFQIEGGVEGFVKRVTHYQIIDDFSGSYGETVFAVENPNGRVLEGFTHWYGNVFDEEYSPDTTFLVEKFTARGVAAGPFALKTPALEPLRIEGAILAMGIEPTWVFPVQQYFLPGKDKAEKKKRQHAWLKTNGYHVAPKDVGAKDADDVRSAIAHAISWLRRQKHKPTLGYFRKDDNDTQN